MQWELNNAMRVGRDSVESLASIGINEAMDEGYIRSVAAAIRKVADYYRASLI